MAKICQNLFKYSSFRLGSLVNQPFGLFFVQARTMSDSLLAAVPLAEIDPDGSFKYILIKVYVPAMSEPCKMIVRGNKRGPYHSDIYDETVKKLSELKLDSQCLGGGKIQHNSGEKKIHIFGSSTGFGKANHEVSAGILREAFPDYEVTWAEDEN